MLSDKIIRDLIKSKKIKLTEKTKNLLNKAKKGCQPLESLLLSSENFEEKELYKKAALFFDLPYKSLKGKEVKKEILEIIPLPVATTHQIIAFEKRGNQLKLATSNPKDVQIIEFLRRKTGLEPIVHITDPSEIREILRQYHSGLEEDLEAIQKQEEDWQKAAHEMPVINVVKAVLEHAVYEDASDIHIEPAESEVIIRYRIDGILKQVMSLPKNIQKALTARIKILSNLKIDEHMLPQDGRFKTDVQGEDLAFRVSIIPVYDGEKVVMRLLHEGAKPLNLEQLGFLEDPQEIVAESIKKPHGMILVTGPTGSGKTTTLYSILGILNQPGVNISTIEDPIEYHIRGINQSQINPKAGFTFAMGLRAFLRQDPDIIMVGEIRDEETAEIAIHAAMTGHLVLSTLHTNDAATTLPRLLDMGVPPFLVAYTTNIVIAQRLARKVCSHCKQSYTLDKKAAKNLTKNLNTKQINRLLKIAFPNEKITDKKINKITFYKGAGCKKCAGTGYKGRIGIYEVLVMDEELIRKINNKATAKEIQEHAAAKDTITMLEDGFIKAFRGVTTIAEVLRVTKE